MKVSVDSVGRVVIPKALRERLGIVARTEVDITAYGDGLHVAPAGRTARLEEHDSVLVAVSGGTIDDDDVFALIDTVRR